MVSPPQCSTMWMSAMCFTTSTWIFCGNTRRVRPCWCTVSCNDTQRLSMTNTHSIPIRTHRYFLSERIADVCVTIQYKNYSYVVIYPMNKMKAQGAVPYNYKETKYNYKRKNKKIQYDGQIIYSAIPLKKIKKDHHTLSTITTQS